MSLRVTAPDSPVVWTWRAPTWSRIAFSTIGVVLGVSGLWSYTAGWHGPAWFPAALGASLVIRAVRWKLTLTADAVVVHGTVLSRAAG
jgi:hypothetical protein